MISFLIPGKLYKLGERLRFYPKDIAKPDPFRDSTILPIGEVVLFLYSKPLQRFNDPEQLHHFFFFKSNVYTLAFYLCEDKENELEISMRLA